MTADSADELERRRMDGYLRGRVVERRQRARLRWAAPFKAAVRALIYAFRIRDQLETRKIWKDCSDLTRECATWLRHNDHRPQPRAGRR